MKPRYLLMKEVTFSVDALPESESVRGNAMSSGDDNADREAEESILAALNSGNEWAWCCVRVTAHWGEFQASAYLGCCSYESKEAFCDDGYFVDMKEEALEGLNATIQDLGKKIGGLFQ